MLNDNSNLGDICKFFEKNFSPEIMIPLLPTIIRLDGNNFSKWTKGLKRPFDSDLSKLMVDTTKFLVKETNAVVGYTQSDEITLILYSDKIESQIYQNGKKQKILSKLTPKLCNFFNAERKKYPSLSTKSDAVFDARIFQVPNKDWAIKQLLWREIDATKNSITMASRVYFSDKEIFGKKGHEKQDMLMTKGVNWNDYPDFFKKGTYVKREVVSEIIPVKELENLPLKHKARQDPNTVFTRSRIVEMKLPKISALENPVAVFFG